MANIDNLIPNSERTKEERIEIARAGGIASGKARQEKATMKKTLEMLLDEVAKIEGNEDKLTYRELATLGLIKGSIEGKAENFKTVMQVLGELEEEKSETPVININVVDQSELEKALYEGDE